MRKLTEREIDDRKVKKIVKRINSLEKDYSVDLIHRACDRYTQANLQTRKALKDMREAKQKFEEAKEKLAR